MRARRIFLPLPTLALRLSYHFSKFFGGNTYWSLFSAEPLFISKQRRNWQFGPYIYWFSAPFTFPLYPGSARFIPNVQSRCDSRRPLRRREPTGSSTFLLPFVLSFTHLVTQILDDFEVSTEPHCFLEFPDCVCGVGVLMKLLILLNLSCPLLSYCF